ncbi:MAG: methylglyoxal synthase [Saccharofermentanales bacterium]
MDSMKIVLLADISKNELLVNFCVAYQQILGRHELMAPHQTAQLIASSTSLRPTTFSNVNENFFSLLASKAFYNEIDALIYLRDPKEETPVTQQRLFLACDANSIPFATNTATAEMLVLAIGRGDLDWRELIRT